MQNLNKFKNKKVLITGHNGFKGSWLTIWMSILGAKVIGISLPNNHFNNHFNLVKKKIKVKSFYIDVRNKKKIKNLKKIVTISVFFVFLFISIDRAINLAPQKEIVKKMVYVNNKLSNNKILNNDISEADYIRNSIKKNYTIFDKQFQEQIALNYFSQIRSLKSTLEANPHVGFFVPPDNNLIWNFSEQHISKLILCNNSLHIVPSLVGYATIFGGHPLKFDCPKEAYTNNYLPNNNSSDISKINLCQRAKKINLRTIYILNEENNKLKTKIIDCDY